MSKEYNEYEIHKAIFKFTEVYIAMDRSYKPLIPFLNEDGHMLMYFSRDQIEEALCKFQKQNKGNWAISQFPTANLINRVEEWAQYGITTFVPFYKTNHQAFSLDVIHNLKPTCINDMHGAILRTKLLQMLQTQAYIKKQEEKREPIHASLKNKVKVLVEECDILCENQVFYTLVKSEDTISQNSNYLTTFKAFHLAKGMAMKEKVDFPKYFGCSVNQIYLRDMSGNCGIVPRDKGNKQACLLAFTQREEAQKVADFRKRDEKVLAMAFSELCYRVQGWNIECILLDMTSISFYMDSSSYDVFWRKRWISIKDSSPEEQLKLAVMKIQQLTSNKSPLANNLDQIDKYRTRFEKLLLILRTVYVVYDLFTNYDNVNLPFLDKRARILIFTNKDLAEQIVEGYNISKQEKLAIRPLQQNDFVTFFRNCSYLGIVGVCINLGELDYAFSLESLRVYQPRNFIELKNCELRRDILFYNKINARIKYQLIQNLEKTTPPELEKQRKETQNRIHKTLSSTLFYVLIPGIGSNFMTSYSSAAYQILKNWKEHYHLSNSQIGDGEIRTNDSHYDFRKVRHTIGEQVEDLICAFSSRSQAQDFCKKMNIQDDYLVICYQDLLKMVKNEVGFILDPLTIAYPAYFTDFNTSMNTDPLNQNGSTSKFSPINISKHFQ